MSNKIDFLSQIGLQILHSEKLYCSEHIKWNDGNLYIMRIKNKKKKQNKLFYSLARSIQWIIGQSSKLIFEILGRAIYIKYIHATYHIKWTSEKIFWYAEEMRKPSRLSIESLIFKIHLLAQKYRCVQWRSIFMKYLHFTPTLAGNCNICFGLW